MRKLILILMLFVLSPVAWATDYLIEDGDDFGNLGLFDYDTFLMTGGMGHNLSLGGWSTGIIEDTDPLIDQYTGGIWGINVSGNSELTINGGEINEIVCDDFSTLNLHGGQILGDLMVEHTTAWVHIYGYGFNNDPFWGSPLTGYWADDIAFSINLVDSTISTYNQIVFHEIPEPATMALLGLGICLIRKRS
jgi:hypothetical protein